MAKGRTARWSITPSTRELGSVWVRCWTLERGGSTWHVLPMKETLGSPWMIDASDANYGDPNGSTWNTAAEAIGWLVTL